MLPRPLKFGILLVVTLFCVSELGRFRPLLAASSGDLAPSKQLKEGGGEEKTLQGFALCNTSPLELTLNVGFSEMLEAALPARQLVQASHHLRGPPLLAAV